MEEVIYVDYKKEGSKDVARMQLCRDLCHKLNQLPPSSEEERQQLLQQIFGSYKGKLTVYSPFLCDMGVKIHAGKDLFINYGCTILDSATVTFGDRVMVGPWCIFYTVNHPLVAWQRQEMEYASPIVIEDDVWIGAGVHIMPGVRIGRGSVIGDGSIVTRDIPPGVVALGTPCRVLRPIGPKDVLPQQQLIGRPPANTNSKQGDNM